MKNANRTQRQIAVSAAKAIVGKSVIAMHFLADGEQGDRRAKVRVVGISSIERNDEFVDVDVDAVTARGKTGYFRAVSVGKDRSVVRMFSVAKKR